MLNPSKSMIIYDNPWTYGLKPSNKCDSSSVFIDEKRETRTPEKSLDLCQRMDQIKLQDQTTMRLAIWPAHIVGPTICGANIQQFANNNRDLPMYIYIYPAMKWGIRPRLADQTAELMVDMLIIHNYTVCIGETIKLMVSNPVWGLRPKTNIYSTAMLFVAEICWPCL